MRPDSRGISSPLPHGKCGKSRSRAVYKARGLSYAVNLGEKTEGKRAEKPAKMGLTITA